MKDEAVVNINMDFSPKRWQIEGKPEKKNTSQPSSPTEGCPITYTAIHSHALNILRAGFLIIVPYLDLIEMNRVFLFLGNDIKG